MEQTKNLCDRRTTTWPNGQFYRTPSHVRQSVYADDCLYVTGLAWSPSTPGKVTTDPARRLEYSCSV